LKNIKGRIFNSPEELYDEIKCLLKDVGLEIGNKREEQYHFVLELFSENLAVATLQVYYNKFNQCTNVFITKPIEPKYYYKLDQLFPLKKVSIKESDALIDYLYSNYKFSIDIINKTDKFICYEVKDSEDHSYAWVKIDTEERQCKYLNGCPEFFDNIQYIYEEEYLSIIGE